ncbi:MAG: PAS domain-containing sensor histidine kinase, partial [Chloroflexota bacterium]
MMKSPELQPELLHRLQKEAERQGISANTVLARLLENSTPTPVPPPRSGSLQFLEQSTDAIIIIDRNQTILRFNRGAEKTFGYTFAEVFGKPLDILLPADTHTEHQNHVESFARSEISSRHMAQRRRVFGLRKDGEQFPVEVSISKFFQGDRVFFAAILRDITEHVVTVEALKHNAEVFRLVAENVNDLVCLHDPDGTFMYVSPSAVRIGGRTPEEFIGTSPYDYFHPDDLEAITANHHQSLATAAPPGKITYRHRHKDGHYIWLETTNSPILDDDDNVTGLVTVSRDITEEINYRHELQNERDLLNSIMQTSPSAITVVSKDGQIVFVNRRSGELLGVTESEQTELTYDAPQWKHTDYDGNPWPDEKQPFVRVMETKQPVWDVRHAIVKPDGTRIYLAINGAPIFDDDGEISKIVFTIEDYTSRQHAEDEMANAIRRERELNQIQAAFISMVSHEFRTPMAVIMTSASILQTRLEQMGLPELNPRLQKIEAQVTRLDAMIADATVINRSHVAGFRVQQENIYLPDFFAQLCEEIHTAYPEHTPPAVVNEGTCTDVTSDSNLLQHIFQNLFSNAMKYAAPGQVALCRYHCD